jgi:hypothetical protein
MGGYCFNNGLIWKRQSWQYYIHHFEFLNSLFNMLTGIRVRGAETESWCRQVNQSSS